MGELMTEKGGPMPLMGELSVLMGECSCPGEPSGAPRPGPSDGCSEGAAMEPRPAGELSGEEFTCVEKSARQEAQEAAGQHHRWPAARPGAAGSQAQAPTAHPRPGGLTDPTPQ